MKTLLTFILLNTTLFTYTLASSIPLALQKKLCDQLANSNNRCENGSTLSYYKHAMLDDDKLLLFIRLEQHEPFPRAEFHSAIPVIVDTKGRWISTVGDNSISETIDSIHQDPKGNIWVRTHWQIEGVYPAFYHSKNGLKWTRTRLPTNRNVDCCFESVDEPHFLYNSIALTFRDFDKTVEKTWLSPYQSAMSATPSWQYVEKIPLNTVELLANNHWKMTTNSSEVIFTHPYHNVRISLATQSEKTNQKIYKLQLGAYAKKSSAIKVQKSLENLDYFLDIVKEKKYYKLYLGSYTSYKKANFILKKLKREHPNNKTLQKAFILTSKAQ